MSGIKKRKSIKEFIAEKKEQVKSLFSQAKKGLGSFARDESGQSMVEYVVVIVLIVIVAIVGLRVLGTTISSKFGEVDTALNS